MSNNDNAQSGAAAAKVEHLTMGNGCPVSSMYNTQTAGPRGPIMLQDLYHIEKTQHFNRERIPERIVHAKGGAAFGTFTVTSTEITKYTRAKIFNEVGKKTRMIARFSTVAGERGSADTNRDPRGFALKFYTEDGIWDAVCNNTPIFFVKDPLMFSEFIHSQKRHPHTNLRMETMMWDFWSLVPESMHQVMILMSNRGTPKSWRQMDGFSSHTYSFINDKNERVWMKLRFQTQQGKNNFKDAEAKLVAGEDPDHNQRDLVEAIERGDFPKWTLKAQIMTDEQAAVFRWNPFDLTKVWPHAEFPEIEIGVMELNEIPANYFASVEQVAFSPANVVDGISWSPDKMLQGRLLSYKDAHLHRLGPNYDLLPVNRCPFAVNPHRRDGLMRPDDNEGARVNYFPNSFDPISASQPKVPPPAWKLDGELAATFDRNVGPGEDDHFSQAGNLFRKVLDAEEKADLISNYAGHMGKVDGPKRAEIVERSLRLLFAIDTNLGKAVAEKMDLPALAAKLAKEVPQATEPPTRTPSAGPTPGKIVA